MQEDEVACAWSGGSCMLSVGLTVWVTSAPRPCCPDPILKAIVVIIMGVFEKIPDQSMPICHFSEERTPLIFQSNTS